MKNKQRNDGPKNSKRTNQRKSEPKAQGRNNQDRRVREKRTQAQGEPHRQESTTSNRKSQNKQKKASIGRQYLIVSYLFVAIFLSLIGYLVYFNVYLREDYQTSPYNKRVKTYQEHVVRGSILSSDGTVLAKTDVDGEGNETRTYPYDNVFAHVVGYNTNGKSGLESTEGIALLTSHADPLEQVQKEFKNEKNIGDNLVTTLNANLQQVAYDALGGNKGAVIVMDPATGDVLVDVSKKDFNPNTVSDDWESLITDEANSPLLNRALQGLYPPGSTFKIVTALAYLQQNGTFDNFSFDCQGELTYDDYTIHCAGNAVHGQQNFAEAFANSCNCAFAQMGVDMDKNKFESLTDQLSFGTKFNLELPSSKSRFSLDNSTANPLVMQTSIGQGNTVMTPVHLAMIAGSVANDGVAMTPNFVKRIENHTGTEISTNTPQQFKRFMTAEEASLLSELMKGVVQNGTGGGLSDLGITIAGKTGSAEHGDMTEDTHSWFVGFSDTGENDIVVCVLAESAGSGSSVAVPIARQIFASYYGL